MAPVVEIFRYAFTGAGTVPLPEYGVSVVFTAIVLFVGLILFHRAESFFIDVA